MDIKYIKVGDISLYIWDFVANSDIAVLIKKRNTGPEIFKYNRSSNTQICHFSLCI